MAGLYGGVEAGGTKFNCVVAGGPEDIRAESRIATSTPEETISRVSEFFVDYQSRTKENLLGVGLGSFGPLDLDPRSATFGYITSTPKPGWAQFDLTGRLKNALNLPVVLDTDVNTAAIGEQAWGSAQGLDDLLYLTIGTGIGGGAFSNGKPVHGLLHPEMGHIPLPHDLNSDPYPGWCPYHKDCFEGLAAGPAMKARWRVPSENLPKDHAAWALEAHYIALALQCFILTLSPRRIILGGGVMQSEQLFPLIRAETRLLLNSYVQSEVTLGTMVEYIVPPKLGPRAGVLGAVAMAMQALG